MRGAGAALGRAAWAAAATASLGIGLGGCVSRQAGRLMQADIQSLRVELQRLGQAADSDRAQAAERAERQEHKLDAVAAGLAEFSRSARLTDADYGAQLERLIHDTQELRGAVEVNEHRIGEAEQGLAERIAALTRGGGADPNEAAPAAELVLPKDPKEALAQAVRLLQDGRRDEGRVTLRYVVRQWPRQAGVADEALFRLAETYFDDKQYEAALREYVKVVDKFGSGTWVSDAYYKIGLCSAELGRLEDAQTFLAEVVNNHRRSPLAKQARAKMDEIAKRQGGGGKGRPAAKKRGG